MHLTGHLGGEGRAWKRRLWRGCAEIARAARAVFSLENQKNYNHHLVYYSYSRRGETKQRDDTAAAAEGSDVSGEWG